MAIPKIIHFVWFGGNPHSKIVEYCINSWKKYCPDYEIIEWNEKTFDINVLPWTKEAYNAKKWAFVSDYVRLYALYKYGGVYIDSDVELLKSLNSLLKYHAFTGYEDDLWIPAAIMGAEKGNAWIKLLLDYYQGRHFIAKDGTYNIKENTIIITELSTKECGYKLGDSSIKLGNVKLFSTEYFQPYKKQQFDLNNSENINNIHSFYKIDKNNTFAIHHCTGSWDENQNLLSAKIKGLIRKHCPQSVVNKMRMIYYKIKTVRLNREQSKFVE